MNINKRDIIMARNIQEAGRIKRIWLCQKMCFEFELVYGYGDRWRSYFNGQLLPVYIQKQKIIGRKEKYEIGIQGTKTTVKKWEDGVYKIEGLLKEYLNVMIDRAGEIYGEADWERLDAGHEVKVLENGMKLLLVEQNDYVTLYINGETVTVYRNMEDAKEKGMERYVYYFVSGSMVLLCGGNYSWA